MNQYQSGGLWSAAAHELAAALWAEGVSAGIISSRLREEHDLAISRSAVIGRMRRTGTAQGDRDGKPKVARPVKAPPPSPPPRPPSPPQRIAEPAWQLSPRPVEPLAPRPVGGVRLVDTRDGMCRYIAGQPTAYAVCCGPERCRARPGAHRTGGWCSPNPSEWCP